MLQEKDKVLQTVQTKTINEEKEQHNEKKNRNEDLIQEINVQKHNMEVMRGHC